MKSITTESDLLVHAGSNKFTRSGDFSSQTFTATAYYTDIPYTVDGDENKGTHDQVVKFKDQNYVYNNKMQNLVQGLTGKNDIVSLEDETTVTYNDPSQPVDVTVTVNFSATRPDNTKIVFTAKIILTVENFSITKESVDNITENENSIKNGTTLTYEKKCTKNENENETSFTCTVTVTKLTKSDGTEYTVNASGTKPGTVKTSTKQIFY